MFDRIKCIIMWHSKIKTNKVWQSQDCKHEIFQHLHPPAQLHLTQHAQQPTQQVVHLN